VIFEPMAWTIRQPPISVPSTIAAWRLAGAEPLGLAPGEVRELGWRHPRRWLA
jgi:hypothetical protein